MAGLHGLFVLFTVPAFLLTPWGRWLTAATVKPRPMPLPLKGPPLCRYHFCRGPDDGSIALADFDRSCRRAGVRFAASR
jgi:hypothetical protein